MSRLSSEKFQAPDGDDVSVLIGQFPVSSLKSQDTQIRQSKKSAESSLLPVNKVYEDGIFLNFKDFPTGQPAQRVSTNRDVKV